jgi:hypothetical protein
MGRYHTVEVEVDLSDFDTDELIAELQERDHDVSSDTKSLLTKIYEQRKMGLDYQRELDELIWQTIGRMC